MRAYITGGKGFVGHHLERHLVALGDEVTVTDREVDVCNFAQVVASLERAQPSVIYHLAGLAHVGDSWGNPTQLLSVNVVGTGVVLAAARQVVPEATVIVISSAEVYGKVHEHDLPLTESSPLAPASPYAASKAAAEFVAIQAAHGFSQRVIVVRPFNHIGPGQSRQFAVSAFAHRIVEAQQQNKLSLKVGNLSSRRDFTDVRDVVAAYRLVAEFGESGEIYNVCSGSDVSMQDIVQQLLTIAGADVGLTVDPELLRPVDVPVLRGSAERLTLATGWLPKISLGQTLFDVLAEAQTS
jgi:GDP-4-dehydro-6-deoxy-D-mannose reductase